MNCSIEGCPGEYEAKEIVHTIRSRGEVIVIEHVPAEVCSVCGDALLAPETVRRIEKLLALDGQPSRSIPAYDYALSA